MTRRTVMAAFATTSARPSGKSTTQSLRSITDVPDGLCIARRSACAIAPLRSASGQSLRPARIKESHRPSWDELVQALAKRVVCGLRCSAPPRRGRGELWQRARRRGGFARRGPAFAGQLDSSFAAGRRSAFTLAYCVRFVTRRVHRNADCYGPASGWRFRMT